MIPEAEKDDLFQVRIKPDVDFGECAPEFGEDVDRYLTAHSAHYRELLDRHRGILTVLEGYGMTTEDFNRISLAAADREEMLSECFWALGMTVAAKAAAQPDFNMTAFFAEHLDSYKTPEYYRLVDALDAAYDASARGKTAPCLESLNQERLLREQLFRQRIAAAATHGFEWSAGAMEKAGMHVDDAGAAEFYRIFV